MISHHPVKFPEIAIKRYFWSSFSSLFLAFYEGSVHDSSLLSMDLQKKRSLKKTRKEKGTNSDWRCSIKEGVLKIFTKFIGKHLCRRLFFNKVKRFRNRSFPVSFVKFLRIPFLQYTSGRLVLIRSINIKKSDSKGKCVETSGKYWVSQILIFHLVKCWQEIHRWKYSMNLQAHFVQADIYQSGFANLHNFLKNRLRQRFFIHCFNKKNSVILPESKDRSLLKVFWSIT